MRWEKKLKILLVMHYHHMTPSGTNVFEIINSKHYSNEYFLVVQCNDDAIWEISSVVCLESLHFKHFKC